MIKNNKVNKSLLIAMPVIVLLLVGVYFLITNASGDSNTNQSVSSVTKVEYIDGTYEESISYQVPKSTNTLTAKISIVDDIITEVTTTHEYTSQKSKEYTDPFDKEISAAVVGKKISSVDLSILGGASITSDAFNKIIDSLVQKTKK